MTNTSREKPSFLYEKSTSRRYLAVHLLSFPFWGFLYLLPMILYKDLGASPFQVATIIALKPMASLFSPYWSQLVHGKKAKLVPNLYWANILKFLPFLFFPIAKNPWFFIISFGIFMMLSRGTIPAWMEVLRIYMPKVAKERVVTTGATIDFLGTAILPILFGRFLDDVHDSWRWLFLSAAALGIVSTLFILKLPNQSFPKEKGISFTKPEFSVDNLRIHLIAPLKNATEILSKRPDFLRFQLGFFLGGAGLMIVQPVLPKYFVDALHLSYSGMLTAIAACKGIGFALSSPLWVKLFRNAKIFTLCAIVTGVAALFPFLLAGAQVHTMFVYLAYLAYGIMQGGSELSWKMSGSVFSKNLDSSPFSSINVLAVGVRGLIVPYVGSAFFFLFNSYGVVLAIGAICSLSATVVMARSRKIVQSSFGRH
ncbi:MAG: MFS transporter [Simkaniaceae bacterium]|nr:MFS transporter [Candidatus Sacchlamyda saccharinae]